MTPLQIALLVQQIISSIPAMMGVFATTKSMETFYDWMPTSELASLWHFNVMNSLLWIYLLGIFVVFYCPLTIFGYYIAACGFIRVAYAGSWLLEPTRKHGGSLPKPSPLYLLASRNSVALSATAR